MRKIPEKYEIFYTNAGFGKKGIDLCAIRRNLKALRLIAKQGKEFREKKSTD